MQAQKQLTPFEQALVDSILYEYRDLPSEDELPYEFSPKFQRRALKLLSKTRNPAWYYVNTTFKKVNLGKISADEIARALHKREIKGTAWDGFLLKTY